MCISLNKNVMSPEKKITIFYFVVFVCFFKSNLFAQYELATNDNIFIAKNYGVEGTISNVKICPANTDIISFESRNKDEFVLWIYDQKKDKLKKISVYRDGTTENANCKDLSWMPVPEAQNTERRWFVFVCTFDSKDLLVLGNTEDDYYLQLSQDNVSCAKPDFSPDGEKILYVSTQNGKTNLYFLNPISKVIKQFSNLTGRAAHGEEITFLKVTLSDITNLKITDYNGVEDWPHWRPDGKAAVFQRIVMDRGIKNSDLYVINLGDMDNGKFGETKCIVADNQSFDMYPTWSPDGYKVAYFSYPLQRSAEDIKDITLKTTVLDDNFNPRRTLTTASQIKDNINNSLVWGPNSESVFYVAPGKSGASIFYAVLDDALIEDKSIRQYPLLKKQGVSFDEVGVINGRLLSVVTTLSLTNNTFQIQSGKLLWSQKLFDNYLKKYDEIITELKDTVNKLKAELSSPDTLHWQASLEFSRMSYSGDAPGSSFELGNSFALEYLPGKQTSRFNISFKLSYSLGALTNKLIRKNDVTTIETALIGRYRIYNKNQFLVFAGVGISSVPAVHISNHIETCFGAGFSFQLLNRIFLIPAVIKHSLGFNIDSGTSMAAEEKDFYTNYQLSVSYRFEWKEFGF